METIVDRPELLTPEWLTEALQSVGQDVVVRAVRREQVGTGQMGTSIRLHLDLARNEAGLPDTIVAKLPTADESKRAMVAGIYHTEVEFYRELAPTVAARTPDCHYSALSSDWTSFVLLLEDLAPRVQGDQISGCGVEHARVAVRNLAGLHGPRWCDPALGDMEWMQIIAGDGATMIGLVMRDATNRYLERYAGRISPEDHELLDRIPELLPEWILARPERFAPIHGDYRLDNLMFGDGDDPVATVDWQTITLGLPGRDLAYFLSTGLDPELRRSNERELVGEYHRELVAHGVTDHSLEECFDDYRFGMLQGPMITIVGAAYGEVTDRGDEMFLTMSSRSCQAIRDLGTIEPG
jgi:Phosphotransferase enzyme family